MTPVILITDVPYTNAAFDHVKVVPGLQKSVESKLALTDAPFEKFIFLDSDMLVLSSLKYFRLDIE